MLSIDDIKIYVNQYGDKYHYLPSKTETFYDGFQQVRGILHREDGPAKEYPDGSKGWFLKGKLHREDGPAIEWAHGSKEWHIKGKLHREDGPAKEWAHGSKEWYINGKLHREDGPAIERVDGTKKWYINGNRLSYEEWFERVMTYSSKDNQINVLLKMGQW